MTVAFLIELNREKEQNSKVKNFVPEYGPLGRKLKPELILPYFYPGGAATLRCMYCRTRREKSLAHIKSSLVS